MHEVCGVFQMRCVYDRVNELCLWSDCDIKDTIGTIIFFSCNVQSCTIKDLKVNKDDCKVNMMDK